MESTFSTVSNAGKGYDISEVDRFFAHAKLSWANENNKLLEREVRMVSFSIVNGGYKINEVDEALLRLEKAISKRKKEKIIKSSDEANWARLLNDKITSLYPIFSASKKNRFPHPSEKDRGYSATEVDKFVEILGKQFFEGKRRVDAHDVRTKQFSPNQGIKAYDTFKVDMFLDDIITILNALEA